MLNNSIINENGINVFNLLKKIWKEKFKIFLSMFFSALIAFTFTISQNNFSSTTEIKTISSSEINEFIHFEALINSITIYQKTNLRINDNTINKEDQPLFQFTRDFLLEAFKEVLIERKVFEKAMYKFNLLDLKNYRNEKEYKEAISRLADSVEITTTFNKNEPDMNIKNFIKFTHHDETKWKLILAEVNENANKIVKQNLNKKINIIISMINENKNFQIDAISTQIKNLITDYDRKTSDKIAYLIEQSKIANQLGIAKNNIELKTFITENPLTPYVSPASPFYLRGYEAIEKEIELIKQRTDKKAFISGLLSLEQIKRDLEQDKSIERIKYYYELSPLGKEKIFSAAHINTNNIKYLYKDSEVIIILSIFIGTIIGIIYILIPTKNLSNRRNRNK
jgi:LPS O-antigen subunit length determinant protein (WzzB/FepE family)